MALSSRRTGTFVAISALAVLGSLATPLTSASAADPIESQPAPTLTAPANDTTTPLKDVVLAWDPVTYATRYQIQISPNGDWTNNTVSLPNNGSTVSTEYEVPLSLPYDEYFWRVRALDKNGHTDWSSRRSFLHEWVNGLDILQAPTSSDPTISWTPDPEASLYRVRYSTNPAFPPKPTMTAVCWTANTAFTPYDLVSTTQKIDGSCMAMTDFADAITLYYEVSAWDDSTAPIMAADTEPDANFDCGTAQPACDAATFGAVGNFTHTQPVAGTVVDTVVTGATTSWHDADSTQDCTNGACVTTPTFSWDPVNGANYYRVVVARDPQMVNVYRAFDTQWPSLTPRENFFDAQSGHGYYWQVQAGTCTNSGSDPTCGTPVVDGSDGDGGGGGGGGGTVHLLVYAASAVKFFDKSSGDVPLSKPDDGALKKTDAITFKWGDYLGNGGQGAYDARNYRVQVATDNAFSDVVWDVSDIDMNRWTNPNKQLKDGLYYWRVQPIDESGNHLTWSETFSFSKDSTPPRFKLTDADGIPVTANLHVTVNDASLQGTVSQSTLHVVPVVGGGGAVAGTWHQTAPTKWTFDPSGTLTPGQSYALAVVGSLSDEAGNTAIASGHSVRTTVSADDKSPAWNYSSGWVRHQSSAARGGTYVHGPSGAVATVKLVGDSATVFACRAPGLGHLVIKVDGVTRSTPNLQQGFTNCGIKVWTGPLTKGSVHTLSVTAKGGPADLDLARTA